MAFASAISPNPLNDTFEEEYSLTPPSSNLKIKPIYTPVWVSPSMPTIDYFYDALPENGVFAHKGDGTPLYLGGIGGGTADNNWNKPGVYTVNVTLNTSDYENPEIIQTVLPVIIEDPNADFKIKPIYTPVWISSAMPTIDYFYYALPENGIFAHKSDGTPLYLGSIGGGTADNNWNKPGVYTVNALLKDPTDENSEAFSTVLPVIIEAP